jgi:hypothetical protein
MRACVTCVRVEPERRYKVGIFFLFSPREGVATNTRRWNEETNTFWPPFSCRCWLLSLVIVVSLVITAASRPLYRRWLFLLVVIAAGVGRRWWSSSRVVVAGIPASFARWSACTQKFEQQHM